MRMIPSRMFFTKGVGTHKDKLPSFEAALRDAGIQSCNLVCVSSIFPPNCKILNRDDGLKLLRPGEITFVVLSKKQTDEPNRLISAAIGFAKTSDPNLYGYISEHHAFGEVAKKSGEYAEDLAATMLATTLGVQFDPDMAWDERKQEYISSGYITRTSHICQSAQGNKDGLWTTVFASAVFLGDENGA